MRYDGIDLVFYVCAVVGLACAWYGWSVASRFLLTRALLLVAMVMLALLAIHASRRPAAEEERFQDAPVPKMMPTTMLGMGGGLPMPPPSMSSRMPSLLGGLPMAGRTPIAETISALAMQMKQKETGKKDDADASKKHDTKNDDAKEKKDSADAKKTDHKGDGDVKQKKAAKKSSSSSYLDASTSSVLPAFSDLPRDGLTLLYSAFDPASYPRSGATWLNVAKPTQAQLAQCARAEDDLNMSLSSQPYDFDPHAGLALHNNTLTGPKSYRLGIDARASFTAFIQLRPDAMTGALLTDTVKHIELLKTYANTYSNNGFHLYVVPLQAAVVAGSAMFTVQVGARYGHEFELAPSGPTLLDPSRVYTLTLTKAGSTLSLHLASDADSVPALLAQGTYQQRASEDVLLSNREMVINRYRNARGALFAVGFYSRALGDAERMALHAYLLQQREMASPAYQGRKRVFEELHAELDAKRACPLGVETCDACASVDDWSSVFHVVHTMDERCRLALGGYCRDKANADTEFCPCFNEAGPEYGTVRCQQWRAFLTEERGGKRMRDIDDLHPDDARFVCNKHKDACPACAACPSCPVAEKASSKYDDDGDACSHCSSSSDEEEECGSSCSVSTRKCRAPRRRSRRRRHHHRSSSRRRTTRRRSKKDDDEEDEEDEDEDEEEDEKDDDQEEEEKGTAAAAAAPKENKAAKKSAAAAAGGKLDVTGALDKMVRDLDSSLLKPPHENVSNAMDLFSRGKGDKPLDPKHGDFSGMAREPAPKPAAAAASGGGGFLSWLFGGTKASPPRTVDDEIAASRAEASS